MWGSLLNDGDTFSSTNSILPLLQFDFALHTSKFCQLNRNSSKNLHKLHSWQQLQLLDSFVSLRAVVADVASPGSMQVLAIGAAGSR
jgi:hypothetical protein